MPTGYTARLEEMDYDVKRWLKESIVRNFGVTAAFRDEGWNMTEEELKIKLGKKDPYHEDSLKEYETELKTALNYTEEDWQKKYKEESEKALAEYHKSLTEYKDKKEKYIKVLKELELIKQKIISEDSELIHNVLKFAYNQLKEVLAYDFSVEPKPQDIVKQTLTEYKEYWIAFIIREIDYHKERIDEKNDDKSDKLEWYLDFVEFINKA